MSETQTIRFGSQVWLHLIVACLGFFATGLAVADSEALSAVILSVLSMLNVGIAYKNSLSLN